MGTCCGPAKHDDWPAAGRHREFRSVRAADQRNDLFNRDAMPNLDPEAMEPPAQIPPQLVLVNGRTVNTATGEVTESSHRS
jgi:hypothetical protein